jgi:hypothetical protein
MSNYTALRKDTAFKSLVSYNNFLLFSNEVDPNFNIIVGRELFKWALIEITQRLKRFYRYPSTRRRAAKQAPLQTSKSCWDENLKIGIEGPIRWRWGRQHHLTSAGRRPFTLPRSFGGKSWRVPPNSPNCKRSEITHASCSHFLGEKRAYSQQWIYTMKIT